MKGTTFLQSAATSITILPLIFRKIPKPSTKITHSYRPISSHHPNYKPKTPLFLKPPTHSSTISDLNSFTHWAKTLISTIGSSFLESDNGPDSTHLLRELRWLLEDSIDDPSTIHHLGIHQLGEIDGSMGVVKMRASLEDMYRFWRERVEERRPFQYIVGCEHWRDLVLCVEEGVLIPRPETEMVLDLVCDAVRENEGLGSGLWVDLGTGSGALAVGIGRVLGVCGRVIATDLSPVAVSVARCNVERYGLQDKIEIRQGSWFDPILDVQGELDGLVSNPPYIPSDRIVGLQAEVAKHEPRLALDGGSEGMESLLQICQRASGMLKPNGFFAFETDGEEQCKAVANYMNNETGSSFYNVKITSDFAGIPRFVSGFRA